MFSCLLCGEKTSRFTRIRGGGAPFRPLMRLNAPRPPCAAGRRRHATSLAGARVALPIDHGGAGGGGGGRQEPVQLHPRHSPSKWRAILGPPAGPCSGAV